MTDTTVLRLGPAACRPYLAGCPRTRRAVLIDPLDDQAGSLPDSLAADGWTLTAVIDTHTHADHVSGGARIARGSGVPYMLHELTEYRDVVHRLRDGEIVEAGDVRIQVIHTPGHTGDSISLRTGRHLFTGDFLFLAQDGAGRLDLPGGDPGVHWDSLQRLASIEGDTVVHPGHDYNELDNSTLADERTQNPRFQRVTRDEYVTWQRAIAAPTPQWMLDVIARNMGSADAHAAHHGAPSSGSSGSSEPSVASGAPGPVCAPGTSGGACQAGPMGRVPFLTVEEAARRRGSASPPFLLDVREPFEFSAPTGRHAPGAALVPLQTLARRLPELAAHRDREVLVICKSGGRSARAAEFLIASGFRRVFNVAGGTDAWVQAGLPVER